MESQWRLMKSAIKGKGLRDLQNLMRSGQRGKASNPVAQFLRRKMFEAACEVRIIHVLGQFLKVHTLKANGLNILKVSAPNLGGGLHPVILVLLRNNSTVHRIEVYDYFVQYAAVL